MLGQSSPREGFNATRVYDAGLRSQSDTAIFAYARAHQMTILTFDTDYLNQTAFPPPHAGIHVPSLLSKGDLFSLLYRSWRDSSPLNSYLLNRVLDREKSSIEIV